MTKACKMESVIPLHTCLPCMAGTLQGAFVVIPEISHGDISFIIRKCEASAGRGKSFRGRFAFTNMQGQHP